MEPTLGARREQRRLEFFALASDADARRSGFSARLNMLCSLAGERDLNNGRVDDISALDPSWNIESIRAWLCDDQLPAPQALRSLTRFLVSHLPAPADAAAWEAYLIYGPERVANPSLEVACDSAGSLLPLAAQTLLEIAEELGAPADSYDAQQHLESIVEMLKKLQIKPGDTTLQPGHRALLAARLFPNYPRS
jgi:hypothetical protein